MNERGDSDQQPPGGWGSNKFIIMLAAVIALVALANLLYPRTNTAPGGGVETPSGTSKNQPADSPR
jgi:hypothetical protein